LKPKTLGLSLTEESTRISGVQSFGGFLHDDISSRCPVLSFCSCRSMRIICDDLGRTCKLQWNNLLVYRGRQL
jgi:hypothetical protein